MYTNKKGTAIRFKPLGASFGVKLKELFAVYTRSNLEICRTLCFPQTFATLNTVERERL